MVTFTCSNPGCRKKRTVFPYRLNSHGRNYCSPGCSAQHRRKREDGLDLGVTSERALKHFPKDRHVRVNGKQILVPKGNPTPQEISKACEEVRKVRDIQKENEMKPAYGQPSYTPQEEKYYFIRKVSLSNV